MYLLDTNVISALNREAKHPQVVQWIAVTPAPQLYLSAATIVEIERGIALRRRHNPDHAGRLALWLEGLTADFGERILRIDTLVARRWGELIARIGHFDLDLAIAATALVHGLTVVTRNVGDFLPAGVAVYDPFTDETHQPG